MQATDVGATMEASRQHDQSTMTVRPFGKLAQATEGQQTALHYANYCEFPTDLRALHQRDSSVWMDKQFENTGENHVQM